MIRIVLFGVLVCHGSVWAYGGENAKCDAGDLSCVVAGNKIKLNATLFADWSTANWIGKAVCKSTISSFLPRGYQ